jgi:hypothetical protein
MVGDALIAIGGRQTGLQMAEYPWLLLPGGVIPQLDEVFFGEARWQEGFVVKDDAAVCQFDGFHRLHRRHGTCMYEPPAAAQGRSLGSTLRSSPELFSFAGRSR